MQRLECEENAELYDPMHINVILDLDGQILRWPSAHLPDPHKQSEFLLTLDTLRQEMDLKLYVLTNRPPGQMQAIAYTLGIREGYWVTESGGSVYDVTTHTAYVAGKWQPYIPYVRTLRSILTEELGIQQFPLSGNEPQFEPGQGYIKTVIIAPSGFDRNEYAECFIGPVIANNGLQSMFDIRVGKAIDIDPTGLSKSYGMELVMELNGIDPAMVPTLWIADERRDVDAAGVLVSRGGYISAVGNAHPVYSEFVYRHQGILAPENTSYHESVTEILHQFVAAGGFIHG